MKKLTFSIIAIICFIMPMPLFAQFPERIPSYRTFTSPEVSASLANDILAHLNIVVKNHYKEFSRSKTSMDIIQDEQKFIKFLSDKGLFDITAEARPREWQEVDYVIYIEKREHKDICQTSIVSLATGEHYRTPLLSSKPHHVAKNIALLMAELVIDPRERKSLIKAINSYFSNFWNFRTIDIYYNGLLLVPEGLRTLPISGGLGLTIPLPEPFGFATRFSGIYFDQDQFDVSAGIGLSITKTGRFSPALSLFGGYSGYIHNKTFESGPFLEPAVSLGFYLGENLKLSATGSFQLTYFPESQEFSTRTFSGVKISLGF